MLVSERVPTGKRSPPSSGGVGIGARVGTDQGVRVGDGVGLMFEAVGAR